MRRSLQTSHSTWLSHTQLPEEGNDLITADITFYLAVPAKDYQFSLFDAVCTLQQAWDEVTPMTISNCFVKAGFRHEKDAEACAEEHNHSKHETQEPILKRLFEEYNIPPEVYFTVDDGVATMGSASCPTTVPAAGKARAKDRGKNEKTREKDREKKTKEDDDGENKTGETRAEGGGRKGET
ncbi:hypothetical protein ACOMHN_057773 [Nucella lapillus]